MSKNIFAVAKSLQKKYPKKAWKDLVKMAGKNVSSSTKKSNTMATAKTKSQLKKQWARCEALRAHR